MGNSKNVAEATGKLSATGNNFKTLTRPQLSHVADAMKPPMLAAAGSAGLHPGGLIAKKPWRGVYVRTVADGYGVGYAKGATLVDQPSRAHIITPRKAGSAKNQDRYLRRTGKAKKSIRGIVAGSGGGGYKGRHGLKIGGHWRAYARHPGTKGKHFFDRSKVPTQQAASREMHKQQGLIMARTFK